MFNNPERLPENKAKKFLKTLGCLAIESVKIVGCLGTVYLNTQHSIRKKTETKHLVEIEKKDTLPIYPTITHLEDLTKKDLFDLRQLSRPSFNVLSLIDQIDEQKNNQRLNQDKTND